MTGPEVFLVALFMALLIVAATCLLRVWCRLVDAEQHIAAIFIRLNILTERQNDANRTIATMRQDMIATNVETLGTQTATILYGGKKP